MKKKINFSLSTITNVTYIISSEFDWYKMNLKSWNGLHHHILDYKFIILVHCHFGWSICTNFFITISKVRVELKNRF